MFSGRVSDRSVFNLGTGFKKYLYSCRVVVSRIVGDWLHIPVEFFARFGVDWGRLGIVVI